MQGKLNKQTMELSHHHFITASFPCYPSFPYSRSCAKFCKHSERLHIDAEGWIGNSESSPFPASISSALGDG